MGDSQRDKLVELLDIIIQPSEKTLGDIADYLLANGVIVPPCKVVYYIVWEGTQFAFVGKKSIDLLKIYELKNLKKYGYYLTKEEAEEKLKECNNG